ncbi:MAG: right-handed parallel beta-helix repeat-containing protein [Bacteroidales bacterium]|nr:MAG: right-handed parallel beta-helix repeat-containing protein [Bacteroidales bacterium]
MMKDFAYLFVLSALLFSPLKTARAVQNVSSDSTIRIEAEHFDDIGDFIIEARSGASNDTVLKAASSNTFSRASYLFQGDTGVYGISIGYLDEGDGASTFRCLVGDRIIDSWIADNADGEQYLKRDIPGIRLENEVQVHLESIKQSGENGRIDFLEIRIDSSEFDTSRLYQAEKTLIHNGSIESGLYGYTGTGYVSFTRSDTSQIVFKVYVDTSQYYSFYFRYLLPLQESRPAIIRFNDNPGDSLILDFFYTGNGEVWKEQILTHQLDSGFNDIRLTARSDSGMPYLDRLKLKPANITDSIPEEPYLLYPPQGDYMDSSFVFQWLGAERALNYGVYISTDNPPSETDLITVTSQTSYPVSGLQDGSYFWSIKATNDAGGKMSSTHELNVKSYSNIYYVSVDGNDLDDGSYNYPFRTLSKALAMVLPGDTIFIRGGIYNQNATLEISNKGTSDKLIGIFAYGNEIPVFECQAVSGRGFKLSGHYLHLKGIIVRNAGDNGIFISGSDNIIDRCITTGNKDSGIHLTDGASENIIVNCDSYRNYDPQNNGENADGFAAKFDVGPGNKFIGCRAYENSDDGWDFWEANEPIELENCWAFSNGINQWGDPAFSGDGNGFKMGGNYSTGPRELRFCSSFLNVKKGFDQNHNIGPITLINNTAYKNGDRNVVVYEEPVEGVHVFINNISYQASNNFEASSTQLTNSWNGFTINDSDFASLDSSGVRGARQTDGSLPDLPFLHLAFGSSMIDAGTETGYPFQGSAPDLGAFEGPREPVGNNIEIFAETANPEILAIYPNPVKDIMNFKFILSKESDVFVELLSVTGSRIEVLADTERVPEGEHTLTCSFQTLASGIYFIHFISEDYSETKIVIKE